MKKEGQTTFKQAPVSERNKQHILDILKEEGLTEKQINEMPWEKVWKLYLESVGELFSREFGFIYKALEENPRFAHMLNPGIKAMREGLEKFVKELEDKEKKKNREKESS